MRNICVYILLISISTLSFGEGDIHWLFLYQNKNGSYFYNKVNTNRFGDIVETEVLFNLKNPKNTTYSYVSDIEFNCRNKTKTIMTEIQFPQLNAKGKAQSFSTYVENDWPRNQPVSADSKLFKKICGSYLSMVDNK